MSDRRLAFVFAGLAAGCAANDRGRPPGDSETPVACQGLGEVADLSYALAGGTLRDAVSYSHALAESEELLGYLGALQTQLGSGHGHETLHHHTVAMAEELDRRSRTVEEAMAQARATHETARASLEKTADCGGVDLRETDKTPPKRCTSALRLWTAVDSIDLTSAVDTRSVAQHVTELRLDETSTTKRDAIAAALLDHADRLAKLQGIIKPPQDKTKLAALRQDLQQSLDDTMTSCLVALPSSKRVAGGGAKPRQATVVVKPQYPDQVADVYGDMPSFGSGFVVRWQTTGGDVETRVVTNAHVMSGARQAEIIVGEELDKHGGAQAEQPEPIRATVVRVLPYDDIAILRVEDSPRSRSLLAHGLGFRRTPIDEQEPIVAAGFPGVGRSPSYQVSEGTVSNARFRGRDGDQTGVTGYIQHTAAIDPGNSGGPLLDGKGNVVGVNTLKLIGRENVALAIPIARVQFAMRRVEEPAEFTEAHARAACNLAVTGLSSRRPAMGAVDRLALSLYDDLRDQVGTAQAVQHRRRVSGAGLAAADAVRGRIYGAVRAGLDNDDGIVPFTTCDDVTPQPDRRYNARVRTRKGERTFTMGEEDGLLRVVAVTLASSK